MYSLNVKSHLESLLASYLSEFVEEHDSTSLSFGIWQGHIKLTNLKLKPQVFDVGDNIPMILEYGVIKEVQIIVPWAQIQSGNVTVIVDKVHLVFRGFPGENGAPMDMLGDGIALQRKLAALNEKERRMLGDDSPLGKSSFASRMVESFTSSLKSNVLNGISITVTDVKVSALFPLTHEGEMLHIRLNMDSATIKKDTDSGTMKRVNYMLRKQIEVHGISLEINRKKCTDDFRNQSFLQSLGALPPAQLVLNPVHLELSLSLWQDQDALMDSPRRGTGDLLGDSTTPQTLSLDCNISSFELTPHITLLNLVQEGIDQANFEMSRQEMLRRCGALRPSHPPSAIRKNSRDWWRFAISAVLFHLFGEKSAYRNSHDGHQKLHTQRSLRNRYIFLYCQQIESRILRKRGGLTSSVDVFPESALAELNELHMSLSFENLVLYRAIVHQNLRNLGYYIDELRASISDYSPSLLSRILSRSSEDRESLILSKVDDDIDSAILSIFSDFQMKEVDRMKVNELVWDFNVVVPRLAISLLENTPSDSLKPMSVEFMPSLTAVMYGVQASFERGEILGDDTCHVRLGSVRLYGTGGIELLSCGENTDKWLFNYNIKEVPTRELALSLQLQWFVMGAVTRHKDSPFTDYSNSDDDNHLQNCDKQWKPPVTCNEAKHIVAEISVANTRVCFDEDTILRLICTLAELETISVIDHGDIPALQADSGDERPLRDLRNKCALYSINNPKTYLQDSFMNTLSLGVSVKWSVSVLSQGVNVIIPHSSCVNTPLSPDSETRKVEAPKGYVEVSYGHLKIQSGDFLEGVSWNPHLSDGDKREGEIDLSGISTRSIWPEVEKVIMHKLHRVNTALLNPIDISLCNVTVTLVDENDSRFGILKIPWNARGLVTPCAFLCHKHHPDLQVDLYCSLLHMQCTPQVVCVNLKVGIFFLIVIYALISVIIL